jgi:hypothetical protein
MAGGFKNDSVVTHLTPPSIELLMRRVIKALSAYRYRFGTEVLLHEAMAAALESERIAFTREFIAGPKDRFDFLVEPGLVIEAKIKGSFSEAAAQCMRYAKRDDVRGVILAATRFWAGQADMPEVMCGKPVAVIRLRGAL